MTGRKPHVIGFAGYSGSGKTTLAVQVVDKISRHGLKVAVVKHDGHGHYREAEGTDSARYAATGAEAVIVAGPGYTYKYEKTGGGAGLRDALAGLDGFDLIVVEGFKKEPIPKLVLMRTEEQVRDGSLIDDHTVALVLKKSGDETYRAAGERNIPVLDIDDPDGVASFVLRRFSYI
ncbi:molybdopterin-guanine dinucleotide biosynthesis protein B [Paenibacillus sp. GYB004]|uniref:molybdopterin-guanine dinucleotide biosynthesis protein B n=1 Tax=Paenibacillus sp. GYB004 TaxID=2994393 RepID=UPI002F967230